MKRMLAVFAAVGAAALASAMVSAQAPEGRGGQNPPPPPQNLQILPKDIPRDQLLTTMRGFNAALGVQCNQCHVQEGRGGRNDMASDEKNDKKIARVMMTMTKNVNDTLAMGITKANVTKVECGTCHRGEAIPKYEAPPAPAPAARPPAQ